MSVEEKIIELKTTIEQQLTLLIDNDYYLLDVPYYSNIGDVLIWKGTLDFLSGNPYKCLGMHSYQTFEFENMGEHAIILLLGGGNFGDLYLQHQMFRKRVIESYPNNKIIMLPQTVYYYGANAIREDSMVFRKHKNLYLCARDRYSYDFMNRYHYADHILLLPDMAFCIDLDWLSSLKPLQPKEVLLFNRIDRERTDLSCVSQYLCHQQYDTSDWPNYEESEPILNKIRDLIRAGKIKEADKVAIEEYLPSRICAGAELISQYKRVYSNRLHGAILAILLGKEVTILDNSYGKNLQYYDTWLRKTSAVSAVKVPHATNIKRFIKFQIALLLTYYDRLLKC